MTLVLVVTMLARGRGSVSRRSLQKKITRFKATPICNDETEESQLWNCKNNEKYEESRDHSQNELQEPSIIIKGRKSTTLPSSNKSAQFNVSLGLKASHSQASKPGYEKGQTDPNDTNPDDSSCHGGKKLEKGATSGKEKDKPRRMRLKNANRAFKIDTPLRKRANTLKGHTKLLKLLT